MKRWRFIAFAAVLILCLSALVSCSREQQRILDRLLHTEADDYSGEEVDAQRVKELEEHISKYSAQVEQLVKDTGKLGIFYKMLALEYMEQEMYGPAAEYFQKSLEVYPNNHVVHYYTGLSQAQFSGSQEGAERRKELIDESAYHYMRAVEIKPDYFDALYALSVLFIFELERPLSAEEYILRALDVRPDHINTLFLLGRIRVIQGRFEEAVEIYDRIGEETESEEIRSRALSNRNRILGGGTDE